jgi:hypothetical protein
MTTITTPESVAATSPCSKRRAQKTIIVGAGPVGALAALYAASWSAVGGKDGEGEGQEIEVYELREGNIILLLFCLDFRCAREMVRHHESLISFCNLPAFYH